MVGPVVNWRPHAPFKNICRYLVAGLFICTCIHTNMNTETHTHYADQTKYNRLASKMSSKIVNKAVLSTVKP